jgi:L-fuconolactonase
VIVDSHQHYWRITRGDYGWLTPRLQPIFRDFMPADMAPLLAAAGVSRTIAVQAAPSEAETDFLLGLARDEPSIAGVVGWTDFDSPNAARRIAAMAQDPLLVGLRPMIHDIADPDWMLSAAVGEALAAMQRAGLVFDALVRPAHLARLRALAVRHPELTIVIDHCAKPAIRDGAMQPWAADMAALAGRQNVAVKLSGLATEAGEGWTASELAPYVVHVLKVFGPDRLLWGSDWPVLGLAGDYAGWMAATARLLEQLTAEARAGVMGANAIRIYLTTRGRV